MSAIPMPPANGRQRKQLSDQLDRLDHIIDLLADNLNAACAEAAKEGARQAAQELIAEVLAHPDLPAALARPVAARPATAAWVRVKALAADLRAAAAAIIGAAVVAAAGAILARCQAAQPAITTAVRAARIA